VTTGYSPEARRDVCLLAPIVVLYLALATAFAIVVPPFEIPDETGHLFYINAVARTGQLPNQNDERRYVEGEGHQFPLYYLPAAVAVRAALADDSVDLQPWVNRVPGAPPASGVRPKFIHVGPSIFVGRSDALAFYGLRGYSIVLGAGTIVLTWLVAGELGLHRQQRLLAAALVATLPQFLFISVGINNDNLATFGVTLAIYCLLLVNRSPTARHAAALGVALGLVLCTKKTALFLIPVCIVVLGRLALTRRLERQALLARCVQVVLPAVAISAWVFARNARLYGDPLGTAMERRTLPLLVDEKSLLDWYWLDTFAPRLAESFVGVFGWMDVLAPRLVHYTYLALGVAALAGVIVAPRCGPERWKIGIAAMLVIACLGGVVVYNLTYTQYQGRFLFPVIAPISALCVMGWRALLSRARLRSHQFRMAFALVVLLTAFAIYALVLLDRFYSAPEHYIQLPVSDVSQCCELDIQQMRHR
jgi:hypothetical protein